MRPSDRLMRVHVTKRNDTNTYIYITVVDNEININLKLRYLLKCLRISARVFPTESNLRLSHDQSVRINSAKSVTSVSFFRTVLTKNFPDGPLT